MHFWDSDKYSMSFKAAKNKGGGAKYVKTRFCADKG